MISEYAIAISCGTTWFDRFVYGVRWMPPSDGYVNNLRHDLWLQELRDVQREVREYENLYS